MTFTEGQEITVMFKSPVNDRGYQNADNYIVHTINGNYVCIKYWNGKEYIKKIFTKDDLIWAIEKYNEISGRWKFCQMCFESPAVKGESLCVECKETNSDANSNE